MSQAIESFKTEYGFYPPSFEQFKRTVNTGQTSDHDIVRAESNQLLPFLNKIAPNHQEASTPSPIADRAMDGYTRLDDWWEFVGCNLDQTTSLQFWLSGLCQNKQFPLTGGLPLASFDPRLYMPVGYNVEVYIDGSDIEGDLDRKVFYDFDTDRMIPVSILDDNTGNELRPVVQYVMEHGKTNGDLFYVYRDSRSYAPFVQPTEEHLDPNSRTAVLVGGSPAPGYGNSAYPAYLNSPNHRGLAYHFLSTAGSLEPTFANPTTFQLIAFGLDGDPGVQDPDTGVFINNVDRGNLNAQGPRSSDNLCNFAQGRLDKYITEQQ
jgi:hypothetical protein